MAIQKRKSVTTTTAKTENPVKNRICFWCGERLRFGIFFADFFGLRDIKKC